MITCEDCGQPRVEVGDCYGCKLLEEAFKDLSIVPGPFRTYPNPMRNDGIFVGQDAEIKPYDGVADIEGRPVYPSVPISAKVFRQQLPHALAERLVARLNDLKGREERELA